MGFNNPFDREVYNNLEKILSSDFNQAMTNADLALREFILRQYATRTGPNNGSTLYAPDSDQSIAPVGFIGDGFKARPANPATMVLTVGPGLAVQDAPADVGNVNIGGIGNVNDTHETKVVTQTSGIPYTVPANSSGQVRYDIIEIAYPAFNPAAGGWPGLLTNSASRLVLNPSTGIFGPQSVPKTLSLNGTGGVGGPGTAAANAGLYYKLGTPGAGVPTTDTGYQAIAIIEVDNGVSSIDYDKIQDVRRMVTANNGVVHVSGQVSYNPGGSPQANVSVSNVIAPPGVKVGAIAVAAGDTPPTGLQFTLFVFTGAAPKVGLLTGIGFYGDTVVFAGSAAGPLVLSSIAGASAVSGTTIAGGGGNESTRLNGASVGTGTPGPVTLTPLKVAVGQPCWRFGMAANVNSFAGPRAVFGFSADFIC